MSNDYVLHNYFRSSTSLRVRIALNVKQISYGYRSYALLKREHQSEAYLTLNPEGLVPALETPDGVITQSLAILEYLDEVHPNPPLLPSSASARARVRSLSQVVGLDIHPVNNLRILQYIRSEFGADDTAVKAWFQRWAIEGFQALEARLCTSDDTGTYCHGEQLTLADVCLVSQAINNRRFDVPLEPYPTLERIVNHCLTLPEVQQALPENQADAPAP